MMILIGLLAVALWILLARIGLRMASDGRDRVPDALIAAAACLGGGACFLAFREQDITIRMVSMLLGGGLIVAALIDRQTGWAPDALMLPIVVLSLVFGAMTGGWNIDAWHAAGIGLGIYILLQGLWLAIMLCREGARLPPPGDIFALLIPLMIFGVGPIFVIEMMMISAALLIVWNNRFIASIFSKQVILETIMRESEMQSASHRDTITLLSLAFPITGVAVLIFSFM